MGWAKDYYDASLLRDQLSKEASNTFLSISPARDTPLPPASPSPQPPPVRAVSLVAVHTLLSVVDDVEQS